MKTYISRKHPVPRFVPFGMKQLVDMADITGAEVVEVTIRADGKVLWINTEDGCVLRICQIKEITIVDERVHEIR